MWQIKMLDEATGRWTVIMDEFHTRDDADAMLQAFAVHGVATGDLRVTRPPVTDRLAASGEPYPCTDATRTDLRGDVRASHHRATA